SYPFDKPLGLAPSKGEDTTPPETTTPTGAPTLPEVVENEPPRAEASVIIPEPELNETVITPAPAKKKTSTPKARLPQPAIVFDEPDILELFEHTKEGRDSRRITVIQNPGNLDPSMTEVLNITHLDFNIFQREDIFGEREYLFEFRSNETGRLATIVISTSVLDLANPNSNALITAVVVDRKRVKSTAELSLLYKACFNYIQSIEGRDAASTIEFPASLRKDFGKNVDFDFALSPFKDGKKASHFGYTIIQNGAIFIKGSTLSRTFFYPYAHVEVLQDEIFARLNIKFKKTYQEINEKEDKTKTYLEFIGQDGLIYATMSLIDDGSKIIISEFDILEHLEGEHNLISGLLNSTLTKYSSGTNLIAVEADSYLANILTKDLVALYGKANLEDKYLVFNLSTTPVPIESEVEVFDPSAKPERPKSARRFRIPLSRRTTTRSYDDRLVQNYFSFYGILAYCHMPIYIWQEWILNERVKLDPDKCIAKSHIEGGTLVDADEIARLLSENGFSELAQVILDNSDNPFDVWREKLRDFTLLGPKELAMFYSANSPQFVQEWIDKQMSDVQLKVIKIERPTQSEDYIHRIYRVYFQNLANYVKQNHPEQSRYFQRYSGETTDAILNFFENEPFIGHTDLARILGVSTDVITKAIIDPSRSDANSILYRKYCLRLPGTDSQSRSPIIIRLEDAIKLFSELQNTSVMNILLEGMTYDSTVLSRLNIAPELDSVAKFQEFRRLATISEVLDHLRENKQKLLDNIRLVPDAQVEISTDRVGYFTIEQVGQIIEAGEYRVRRVLISKGSLLFNLRFPGDGTKYLSATSLIEFLKARNATQLAEVVEKNKANSFDQWEDEIGDIFLGYDQLHIFYRINKVSIAQSLNKLFNLAEPERPQLNVCCLADMNSSKRILEVEIDKFRDYLRRTHPNQDRYFARRKKEEKNRNVFEFFQLEPIIKLSDLAAIYDTTAGTLKTWYYTATQGNPINHNASKIHQHAFRTLEAQDTRIRFEDLILLLSETDKIKLAEKILSGIEIPAEYQIDSNVVQSFINFRNNASTKQIVENLRKFSDLIVRNLQDLGIGVI
ncbi:MAG: hypothetical protein KBC84_07130, partial [Proteobacteria bacterium]|nr:hypothetical protein [Pseudomonadota bacterium]